MSYSIEVTAYFSKQLKRLAKKYPSIKIDFSDLLTQLKQNPKQGVDLGNNCFKTRLAISSKGKGKSAGARVISHLKIFENTIYLLSIYDKSEKTNIKDKDLENWIKEL